jgi:STE24 endopeptidase
MLVLVALMVIARPVSAAMSRPNAIDRQIDAISTSQLLSQPASALVDADRQVAADRLMRWEEPGRLAMVVFEILVLAYFWQSGMAARVRDWLRLRINAPFGLRFAFGAALGALAKFVALPFEFFLYRIDRLMGISTQLSRGWIADWLLALLLTMIFTGLVAAIALWLADRTRRWYIYTVLAILAGSILVTYADPFAIAPLFNHFTPLRAAYAGDLQRLEQQAGYADIPIEVVDTSRRTQNVSTMVIGFGNSRQIVLSDTLVAAGTPGEVAFFVARALRQIQLSDPLRRAAIDALIIILGTALAVFIADRISFRRDDDPLSRLALVGSLLGCAYLVAVPLDNAFSRGIESQADTYAISLTHDPASAVRAMVRRADEQIESPCPGAIAKLYFMRSPAIATRVEVFNGVASGCK